MKRQGWKVMTVMALSAGLVALPQANAATVLTSDQKAQLIYLVEEEKLARDVYNYFAKNVTSRKFANIAKSEQIHMNYISTLLATYKAVNPTTNKAAGVFVNQDLQALYNALTKEGSAGVLAAFGAGVKIEEMDIADLQRDLKSNQPADVVAAMQLLLKGSQSHLVAFKR